MRCFLTLKSFRVQYHDSYKFNAKSYHSMQYHFKSIDTWLKGICKSHCPEHAWKRSKYQPGKKSIFADDQANETPDEDAEQEAEVDEQAQNNVDNDEKKGHHCCADKENENQNAVRHSTLSSTVKKPVDNAVSLQEISSLDNNAIANLTSVSQRPFHNLDECVDWLLSKITFDLEKELNDESNASEIHQASSSYTNLVKEFRQETQRMAQLSSKSAFPRNTCICPQCYPIKINCIHQNSSNETQMIDEDEFGSLEDCRDLTSSLECFDFISSDADSSEVVSVIQCPNNSNSSSNGNARQSVSPSKASKKEKGESEIKFRVHYL